MPAVVLIVETNAEMSDDELERRFVTGTNRRTLLRRLINYLEGVAGGIRSTSVVGVKTMVGDVFASMTIGCDVSDAVDDTDTVTIGPTTFTTVAAPANENQISSPATDILYAAELAAAINVHSVLKNLVEAVSDGIDTVTVTCRLPGKIGNEIAVTEAGNGYTLSGAVLAGGTNNAMVEYDF